MRQQVLVLVSTVLSRFLKWRATLAYGNNSRLPRKS